MSALLPWVPKPGDYWSRPFPIGPKKRSLRQHVEERTRIAEGQSKMLLPATLEEARAMGYAWEPVLDERTQGHP